MLRSIRWRLVLSYVLLIVLTLGVVGAVILRLIEDYVEQQEMEYLTANAEAVAHQAQSLLWPFLRGPELQELAETSAFLGNARVRILDDHRRVLADSELTERDSQAWMLLPHEWLSEMPNGFRDPYIFAFPTSRQLVVPVSKEEQAFIFEQLPSEAALTIMRWQDGAWGSRFEFDVIHDLEQLEELAVGVAVVPRSERAITTPIGGTDEPLGFVEISDGPDFTEEALRTTRQAFLFAAGGAMLLAVIVGLVVSRGLTAPLRELTRVADEMSGGDLATRAPMRRKDEIGQLAGQFNRMAERLESSFAELAAERDALRRFIADASHELRTPITALKSFNDLMQGAAADDPAARAEFLEESKVQIDRLEWVTANLLDLSRLDAGLVTLDLAEHDVGEVIEAAASAFKALAHEKEIAFSIRPLVSPLELRCDRARLEVALCNLLNNAFKFTSPGGQVQMGAERKENVVRIWVRDDGPGIEPSDLPHIFERFYQGRNHLPGGSGLGLTIAQSIVQAHGGRVSVESEPGAGSFFVLELPLGQTLDPE